MSDSLTKVIDYLIYQSINWYCEQKKITLVEFNLLNDFTKDKVSLLPFFVCLGGNGSMESLYDILGPFIAQSNGPISIEANNIIEHHKSFVGKHTTLSISSLEKMKEISSKEELLISKAFEKLKQNMPELITFSYLELLILCHQFNASYVYRLKQKGTNQILKSDILHERGYYFLAGMLEKRTV